MKNLKEKLADLVNAGSAIYLLAALEYGENIDESNLSKLKKKTGVTDFHNHYQPWYTESLAVIKQILPDRLQEFRLYYEGQPRKSNDKIDFLNYSIRDALLGLVITSTWGNEHKVDGAAAVPKIGQQVQILKSAYDVFDSKLKDIKSIVQYDLFDSDLDAARYLAKKRFLRAAGAMAGVVLEKHLSQICANHAVKVTKRNPTIADFNQTIYENSIIDIAEFRRVGRLADLRNKCDHNKNVEPTQQDIQDLIDGADKTIKELS
jgi:hypothetical protein